MKKTSQTLKTAAAHAGFLAILGVVASLAVGGVASADPGKYRNPFYKPLLVLNTADDFRAPPVMHLMDTANASAATTDDFRAPPTDLIQTGSIDAPKNCTRATYKLCAHFH
jgi:hypothetical protein